MASGKQRDELRARLSELLTPELAEVIMESLPPHRWDELATRDDIRLLKRDVEEVRGDVGVLKGDVGALKGDVGALKGDVGALKGDVGVLKGDMAGMRAEMAAYSGRLDGFEERAALRAEAMEHRLAGEMRRLYVDQTRLLFFSMIGAIFTTATLAFAAVRF